MRYLIPYLENMGARVFSCRERGEIPFDAVGDNDQGARVYRETGPWFLSSSRGYGGGTYRYAATSIGSSSSTATWTLRAPASGSYPVYVYYRAGANRAADARYFVRHRGGTSYREVDQTRNDRKWVHIGDYWFDAGATAVIGLESRSARGGRVVIADAVRLGAGRGSIVRGSRSSQKLRAQECSRYWAQFNGAPASVYNSSTGNDHADDVTCRPRYAEWRGADCYISLHTNAGGGSGTSSYIHNTAPTRGSAALQRAVQAQIVADIRREYDASWIDRGRRSANFGELRLLSTMPGVLVELAFHDRDKSKDHNALHDPGFRRIGARAYARGVLRYFAPTAVFPPTRPERLRVVHDGKAGLEVAWDAVAGATRYSIERAPDGKSFVEVGSTSATKWSTGPLPHGALWSFRVRASNASGRSFASDVLVAGTSHDLRHEVLLVAGFDRLGKTVKGPENTRDYLRQHGDAIRRSRATSLGFDAASNEAVAAGRVALSKYRAVVWALGEESTADETFSSLEQSLLRSYLQAGGRLFVSGAEIAWDLDAKGTAADRAFHRDVLGARYVRDDAQTYRFRGVGSFAGLGAGSFDDGRFGTYNVDWPDVLAPSDSRSTVFLAYGIGAEAAAISRVAGSSRLVYLGFPFETITNADLRAELMRRALRFLLAPRALEGGFEVALGARAPLDVSAPRNPGSVYVLAASATTQPGLPLGDGRRLPLALDPLFSLSVGSGQGFFSGFAGVLDSNGRGKAAFVAPRDPRLRGLEFFVSGLSIDQRGIGAVLPWIRLKLR